MAQCDNITHAVNATLSQYFQDLDGEAPCTELYNIVMARAEKPLIEAALAHVKGNQTKAAALLGLNRNTLRKKMKIYQLD